MRRQRKLKQAKGGTSNRNQTGSRFDILVGSTEGNRMEKIKAEYVNVEEAQLDREERIGRQSTEGDKMAASQSTEQMEKPLGVLPRSKYGGRSGSNASKKEEQTVMETEFVVGGDEKGYMAEARGKSRALVVVNTPRSQFDPRVNIFGNIQKEQNGRRKDKRPREGRSEVPKQREILLLANGNDISVEGQEEGEESKYNDDTDRIGWWLKGGALKPIIFKLILRIWILEIKGQRGSFRARL